MSDPPTIPSHKQPDDKPDSRSRDEIERHKRTPTEKYEDRTSDLIHRLESNCEAVTAERDGYKQKTEAALASHHNEALKAARLEERVNHHRKQKWPSLALAILIPTGALLVSCGNPDNEKTFFYIGWGVFAATTIVHIVMTWSPKVKQKAPDS